MFEGWHAGAMSGGRGRPWSQSTLGDRIRVDPNAPVRPVAAEPLQVDPVRLDPVPSRPTPVHHCWVEDAPGHPGRYPGLLLEWRREATGWSGLVAYVMPDLGPSPSGGERVRLTQRWLPGTCLRPVDESG